MSTAANNIDDYIAELEAKLAKGDCATTHYNLGVAYISKRRFEQAKTCFLRAVDLSPSLAEAYVQLGGLAMNENDLDACLRYNTARLQGTIAIRRALRQHRFLPSADGEPR